MSWLLYPLAVPVMYVVIHCRVGAHPPVRGWPARFHLFRWRR